MKKVAILPGVFLVALLLTGLGPSGSAGIAPGLAQAETIDEAAKTAAPLRVEGETSSGPILSVAPIVGSAAPLAPLATGGNGTSSVPDRALLGSCTFTVLPQDNSTSGNERAPTLRNRFGRSVYLITAGDRAVLGNRAARKGQSRTPIEDSPARGNAALPTGAFG